MATGDYMVMALAVLSAVATVLSVVAVKTSTKADDKALALVKLLEGLLQDLRAKSDE